MMLCYARRNSKASWQLKYDALLRATPHHWNGNAINRKKCMHACMHACLNPRTTDGWSARDPDAIFLERKINMYQVMEKQCFL